MAENKNLDELNMLQNDGKVDTTQAIEEDRKDVEAVAKGKKTVDEAPQAVTVELLKEYANQNKIFSKLESHCEQDGVDIYAYFLKCFNKNETVKVSNILDNIAKKIPTLIDTINDDKNNNLFIDGNGNIDIEGAIRKAKQNERPLPAYIKAIAEDAGKESAKEVKKSESIIEYLAKKDEDFFRNVNASLSEGLGDSINNILDSLNENTDENEKTNVNIDGKNVSYYDNLSKEDNVLLNKLQMMKSIVDDNKKFSHSEAPEYIVKLVIMYRECAGIDISKSTIPNIAENLKVFMDEIEEAFKVLSNGLDIKKISTDKDWKKILYDQIDIQMKELDEIEGNLLKELNENVEELTDKAKELFDSMQIKKNEDVTAKKDNSDRLLIYAILENLEDNEKEGFAATYFGGIVSKKRRLDTVDNTLKKNGENYVEEAKKTGLYRRIKLNVNTDIYLDILKRERFKQSLKNFKNPIENTKGIEIPESVREMPVFLLALDMIDGDKSVGYTDEDVAAKEEAIKFMKEKFPEAFKDDTFDKVKLFELACEKYQIKHPKVTNFEELFEYAQKYNDNAIKSELTYALKYDAQNVDMSNAEIFSLDQITQILNDEKILEEVRRKVKSHRSMAFENRVVDELENGFMELYNARNNDDFSDLNRRELIKKALIMADKLPTNYKERMMHPENCDLAKKVLMEFIPEAILMTGNIGSQKSRDAITEYFKQHGELISLKGERSIGHILLDSVKRKVSNQTIDYSPEEIKKRAEEVKNKKEYVSKKISIEADIKVLKYIKLLREQGTDEKTVEELDKLEKIIYGRIERKNPEKGFLKQVSEDINNIPKNDILSSQMARTTRRLTASKRIEELRELHKDGSKLSEEELKEVFDICAGLRNDYLNETIDTKDYKKLMLQMSCYVLKKNGYDFIEKSKIDDEKFLLAYNKLFGTEIKDVNKLYEEKESELIGKGISKSITDIDGGKKGLISSTLLYEVSKDDFEPKQKLADYRNERTTLDIKDTIYLAEKIMALKNIKDVQELDEGQKYEYVTGLVVLAKILKEKNVSNKVSYARYTEFKNLNQKLFVVVKNELQEYMPEAFTVENGYMNLYNLNTSLMKFLQDYNVAVPSDTKTQERFLSELTKRVKKTIKENPDYIENRTPIIERAESVTAKLNDILTGTMEEKTGDTYISSYAIVKAMEEKRNITNLTSKMFQNVEKENPELYSQIAKKAEDVSIDDSAMYKMAAITGEKIMAGHQEKIKQAKYVSDTGKAEVSNEDKASMILNAIGVIESLKQLSGLMNESEFICIRNARIVLKDIAPEAIQDGMHIDETVLLNVYNGLNSSGKKDLTIEELKNNAVNQLLVKTAKEITNTRTINSRYNEILEKYSVTREKENIAIPPISTSEMDRIYEQQAEEIIVDSEVPQRVDEEISSADIGAYFEAEAVEVGDEVPKKVEQHVEKPAVGMHAENIEVSDESWRENLPVEQKQKGFFGNIFDKIKAGLKIVKDRIFGTVESNTETGTTDNNTASTTSGTGGVNKDEQNVMNLTGHGKINLTFTTPAVVGEEDKKSKSMESTEVVRPDGDEKE